MRYVLFLGIWVIFISFSSGCSWSWLPWVSASPEDLLVINLSRAKSDKTKEPLTIIIVQPAEQKSFVAANYASVIQQSLDKGVKRYVMLGDQKSDKIIIAADKTPLAIYFILKEQPTSNWKYLIDAPQGSIQLFTINSDGVTQENKDG